MYIFLLKAPSVKTFFNFFYFMGNYFFEKPKNIP
jgi:hypothetical protein